MKWMQVNWIKLKSHYKHISLLVEEQKNIITQKTIVSRQVLLSNCKIDT